MKCQICGRSITNPDSVRFGIGPKCRVKLQETVLLTAKTGGKHSGYLRQFEAMSDTSLARSIRSYLREIQIHQEKLQNPEPFLKRQSWSQMSNLQRSGLIRHWEKEIRKFQELALLAIAELQRRKLSHVDRANHSSRMDS